MANQNSLNEFFSSVEAVIAEMSKGDPGKEKMLREFFVSVLSVLDGLEGRDVRAWKGIALVAREDLPPGVQEINSGFLHDLWSER